MNKSRHDFPEMHPEAYHSFIKSGWQDVQFVDSSQSPPALVATNSSGQEIVIDLPKRPGVTIPDSAMLNVLRQNDVKLRPLRVDLAQYAEGCGFIDSSKGADWMEKPHRQFPDEKAYLNKKAQFPGDVLLSLERLDNQIGFMRLEELDNLYMLGEYLEQNGYPGR